jgi:uncharacterized protein
MFGVAERPAGFRVTLVQVIFEWDARKAAANLKKHRVAFEDAATVFLDPLAGTYPDPDHSLSEHWEITIDHTLEGHLIFVAPCERGGKIRIVSARLATARERNSMRKKSVVADRGNDMRAEHDLSQLKGGVRGKYYRQATAGTNLVLIEPDPMDIFPESEAVNRALRILAEPPQLLVFQSAGTPV